MLSIALPKGRLSKQAYKLFCAAGLECPGMDDKSRKLVFTSSESDVRYLMIKPSDVAIYVERGAADIGVVGKDVLLESEPDVYELMDLLIGACKLSVAAPAGYNNNYSGTLRVATKYPNVSRSYYRKKNVDIDIIKLYGSMELAPILGLCDVIVDIVETGSTLKANKLCVTDDIAGVSARLIANKKSMKFKQERIFSLMKDLEGALKNVDTILLG